MLNDAAATVLAIIVPALFGFIVWLIKVSIPRAIDSSMDKTVERYKDRLMRASFFHGRVVDRQIEFLDQLNERLAELIPLVQDLARAVGSGEFSEYQRTCFARYFELTIEIKKISFKFEPYIDPVLYEGASKLVIKMQASSENWAKWAKALSRGESVAEHEVELAEGYSDSLLMHISGLRYEMIHSIRAASGEIDVRSCS